MTTPPFITWGRAPSGLSLSKSELDTWRANLAAFRRHVARRLHGPTAPKRKRPRRVQRKIDARFGAMHYRDAGVHMVRVLAEAERRWAVLRDAFPLESTQ